MVTKVCALLFAVVVLPAVVWAGSTVVQSAPILGETGLIALGISLAGLGIGLLRRGTH